MITTGRSGSRKNRHLVIQQLKHSIFFIRFDEDELDQMLDHAELYVYDQNDVIYVDGTYVYVIVTGEVCLLV